MDNASNDVATIDHNEGMSDNHYNLNKCAFWALKGYALDSVDAVIELLRSDAPIHSATREMLAQALDDGTAENVKLNISGNGKIRRMADGMRARKEWMQIGAWITEQIGGGATQVYAIAKAGQEFADSEEAKVDLKAEKRCEAALKYFNDVSKWVNKKLGGSLLNCILDQAQRRQFLEDLYHERHSKGDLESIKTL